MFSGENKIFLSTGSKTCVCCGATLDNREFLRDNSIFSKDGLSDVCAECFEDILIEQDYQWECVDQACRRLNIPFVPSQFEKIRQNSQQDFFRMYSQFFDDQEYCGLDWKTYYQEFKRLEEAGIIQDELPLLKEEEQRRLREKWGPNYDQDALNYLENLHSGLLKTQNVAGALQGDQSLKLCKISYEIDCRIQEGTEIDKLLKSYETLTKIADFTPKSTKNLNDFDSIGELVKWMEKKGWKNKFYTDEKKDIVDETLLNIQNFNQRLYTNESGIGDEITKRIDSLKTAHTLESYYDSVEASAEQLDQYDTDGFNEWKAIEEEDFIVEEV